VENEQDEIFIRSVSNDDIKAILEIERASFPEPWEIGIFQVLAKQEGRVSAGQHKMIVMRVAEIKGDIVGYIVWEEDFRWKEGRILNIAIRKQNRKRGFGRQLLQHAFNDLRIHTIARCELEVRESNWDAQRLYESVGMQMYGRKHDYYREEDALLYQIIL
jgi:ribosomal-protein-alanine N-acetyltransferase